MIKCIRILLLGLSVLAGVVGVAMTPEALRSYRAFEQRAESGDAEAQYRLSALLERGYDTIPADTVRSLSLLRRSAEAGYAPARNYLGFLYGQGILLPLDSDSARYWIGLAADGGDVTAAHNMAYMLLNEPEQDDSLAVSYLEYAADAGLPQALTLLADLYVQGRGVPTDTVRAINLYENAIDKGFHDAELRLLNVKGSEWRHLTSDESLEQALRYWNMGAPVIAAELAMQVGPEDAATARAYALLGHAYAQGVGVPYDHRKANEYFARAAILGNPAAQFIIAETLEIFPDALAGFMADMPESMTPAALRESAARAGIRTAEQATAAITAPPTSVL